MDEQPTPPAEIPPAGYPTVDTLPRKTLHGRAPKNCRGDRNARQRGAARRSVAAWAREAREARERADHITNEGVGR